MSRCPRQHIDGYPLHIVQRGHNRQRCFLGDDDCLAYLRWLAEALRAEECLLHAYVLMSNHVHLLLTPRDAVLVPRILMSLGRRYVPYFNRRYVRTGTLWESRYRSSLVTNDFYLLACHRYVELNPVRAGMTADPAGYRWSSYGANAMGRDDALVAPHPLYLALGKSADERCAAYRMLFDVPMRPETLDEIRGSLKKSRPIGHSITHRREVSRLVGLTLREPDPPRA
jgi:putative transposase